MSHFPSDKIGVHPQSFAMDNSSSDPGCWVSTHWCFSRFPPRAGCSCTLARGRDTLSLYSSVRFFTQWLFWCSCTFFFLCFCEEEKSLLLTPLCPFGEDLWFKSRSFIWTIFLLDRELTVLTLLSHWMYSVGLLCLHCPVVGRALTHPPIAISSKWQCFPLLSCHIYSLHFFPQMAPRMIFKIIWPYFSTLLLMLMATLGMML